VADQRPPSFTRIIRVRQTTAVSFSPPAGERPLNELTDEREVFGCNNNRQVKKKKKTKCNGALYKNGIGGVAKRGGPVAANEENFHDYGPYHH
jgi:hypothetical protein